MPDQDNWNQGNLADRPIPTLLFHLWQSEETGILRIEHDGHSRAVGFKDGRIAVSTQTLSQKDFLGYLAERHILDSSLLTECESYAEQNSCSLIRALHELSPLRPSETWPLLERFTKEGIYSLFDWDEGRYEFAHLEGTQTAGILFLIQTLPLILQGIRRMRNQTAIEARIPDGDTHIQVLTPYYSDQMILDPTEKYLLNLIKHQSHLETIYESSELGRKDTKKILFAFLSVGLISFSSEKTPADHRQKSDPLEFDEKLAAFNSKFSYIYKYLSKELGPVAFNLIEKCLEELKPHLSSIWQQGKFDSEGRIPLDTLLKTDTSFASTETKKDLIRDLNEILTAEVIAVRKNLGDEHESILVNNLKKTGESG